MPASTDNKALPTPLPPLDPVKRAKAIRDALARRKIKPSPIINQTLEILDEISALELEKQKTA